MFFIAAALVLTTAGVFAGKARFASQAVPNLYLYSTSTGYVEIGSGVFSASQLYYGTTPAGVPATFNGNNSYTIYTYAGSPTQYYAVYSNLF